MMERKKGSDPRSAADGAAAAMHLGVQHFAEVVEALRRGADAASGHERRQITRIETQAPMQIARYVDGSGADEFTVLTRDVSIGGVGLLQSNPMDAGDQIVVRLPRLERPPLFVLSHVTHCRRLADGIYGIGVQFNRLLNTDASQAKNIDEIRRSILGD